MFDDATAVDVSGRSIIELKVIRLNREISYELMLEDLL